MLWPFWCAQMCWLIYSWGAVSAATVWIDTFMHSVVGVKKVFQCFTAKAWRGGGGTLLSPQRGNYCIYDHTKTHALREGNKWVHCSGQGCSALLKSTSAVLWKGPGTSPATRPLFLCLVCSQGREPATPSPVGRRSLCCPDRAIKSVFGGLSRSKLNVLMNQWSNRENH